jgi:hypothetical protein
LTVLICFIPPLKHSSEAQDSQGRRLTENNRMENAMMHISRRVNAQTTAPRPLFFKLFVSSAMVKVCLENHFKKSQKKAPQRKDKRTRNLSLIGSLWFIAP